MTMTCIRDSAEMKRSERMGEENINSHMQLYAKGRKANETKSELVTVELEFEIHIFKKT